MTLPDCQNEFCAYLGPNGKSNEKIPFLDPFPKLSHYVIINDLYITTRIQTLFAQEVTSAARTASVFNQAVSVTQGQR